MQCPEDGNVEQSYQPYKGASQEMFNSSTVADNQNTKSGKKFYLLTHLIISFQVGFLPYNNMPVR